MIVVPCSNLMLEAVRGGEMDDSCYLEIMINKGSEGLSSFFVKCHCEVFTIAVFAVLQMIAVKLFVAVITFFHVYHLLLYILTYTVKTVNKKQINFFKKAIDKSIFLRYNITCH